MNICFPVIRNFLFLLHLVPFSNYLMLNKIVTLKSGLEVSQSLWKIALVNRLRGSSSCCSILSHSNYGHLISFPRLSEILVENHSFFIPTAIGAPIGGSLSPSEYCCRFDTISTCDRQTDGHLVTVIQSIMP